MSAAAPAPRFLGDDPDQPQPPDLPDGWGAVVVGYWFTSAVDLTRGETVVNERPNYDLWVPPPVARVDGRDVRASWSRWWYPLRPGPHDVEVTEPAHARMRVEVTAGELLELRYHADIRIRKDQTDTKVLEWRARATLSTTR